MPVVDRNSIFDFAEWGDRKLPRYEDDAEVVKETALLEEAREDPDSLLPWLLEAGQMFSPDVRRDEDFQERLHPRDRRGRWRPNPEALWRRYAQLGHDENAARSEVRDVEQHLLRHWMETHEEENPPGELRYHHIQGEQHVHTRYSDGHDTIEELAQEAMRHGHKHLVISDHSHLLTPDKIKRQHAQIDKLNETYKGKLRIVKGVEVNIREDGSLDMSDEQLQQFEHVNAGIHADKHLNATDRLLAALDNPHVHVLAHPHTSDDVDYNAVAKKAAAKGKVLEVNGRDILRYDRQGEARRQITASLKHGAKIQISSDAHTAPDVIDTRYAVRLASEAGVKPEHLFHGAHKRR